MKYKSQGPLIKIIIIIIHMNIKQIKEISRIRSRSIITENRISKINNFRMSIDLIIYQNSKKRKIRYIMMIIIKFKLKSLKN